MMNNKDKNKNDQMKNKRIKNNFLFIVLCPTQSVSVIFTLSVLLTLLNCNNLNYLATIVNFYKYL
jgi:hypothetical protein